MTDTTATISWTASTDNVGVHHYNVFRDGVQIGTTTTPTFNDSGLTQQTTLRVHGRRGRRREPRVGGVGAALGHHAGAVLDGDAHRGRVGLALPRQRHQPGHGVAGAGFNDSHVGERSGARSATAHGDEATTVGFGPNATQKYVTTYFRRTFNVANAASVQSLLLRLDA